MAEHAEYEPEHDVVDVSKVIEVKVVVASLLTLLASVIVAVLVAVSENPSILAGLPPWLQFIALAAIPPIVTFAGGYRTRSNRV